MYNKMDQIEKELCEPWSSNLALNFIKIWGAWTLLSVTMAMTTIGKANRSAMLGSRVVLHCPPERYYLAVWNVYFKNGTSCYLSFKRENNTRARNCSMNMDWASTPDEKSSVQIKSSQMFSEGTYMCSIATDNGILSHEYLLTILVPPKVTLIHDNGTAVCKAAAGKPAAQISWNPPGNSTTVSEELLNGTETVTSTYNTTNVKENELTCFISHLTWEKSLILNILLGKIEERKSSTMTILYISVTVLLGIIGFSLFICLWRFRGNQRKITESTNLETTSGQNIQEDDLEPYATFVQVENVIYDKAYNLSSE